MRTATQGAQARADEGRLTAAGHGRSAYIFDTRCVSLGPKIGEVVIVDTDRRDIRLPGIQRAFHGFNRNPYLASFTVGNTDILLANCHLLYGPQSPAAARTASMERRQLETFWFGERPLVGESGHWDASSKSPIYDIRERQLRVESGRSSDDLIGNQVVFRPRAVGSE
ncbi:MAG: hypothetical protein V3T19_01965 [Acidiferrobacterales bacterium]